MVISNTYDQIIAMWSHQDSTLQAYRGIFLTSESILFAIAVFTASGSKPWLTIFLVPIGLFLLLVWDEVCRNKGFDVWFFQWQLLKLEDGQQVSDIFNELVKWREMTRLKKKNTLESDKLGKRVVEKKARPKMEILPALFGILWGLLVLVTLILWLS